MTTCQCQFFRSIVKFYRHGCGNSTDCLLEKLICKGCCKLTICGYTTLICDQALRPTEPSNVKGMQNDYWSRCSDALWLGIEARCGSFHLWIKCVDGKFLHYKHEPYLSALEMSVTHEVLIQIYKLWFLCCISIVRIRHGDGAGNTVEENSSVFSLIRMR